MCYLKFEFYWYSICEADHTTLLVLWQATCSLVACVWRMRNMTHWLTWPPFTYGQFEKQYFGGLGVNHGCRNTRSLHSIIPMSTLQRPGWRELRGRGSGSRGSWMGLPNPGLHLWLRPSGSFQASEGKCSRCGTNSGFQLPLWGPHPKTCRWAL